MSTTACPHCKGICLGLCGTAPSPSPDHPRIWLEPADEACSDTGRMWCQDNVWGDKATEYVRADELSRLRAELDEAQEQVAETYVIRMERDEAIAALASMREALTEISNWMGVDIDDVKAIARAEGTP